MRDPNTILFHIWVCPKGKVANSSSLCIAIPINLYLHLFMSASIKQPVTTSSTVVNNSIKCVAIGDGAIGKTCMLISYSTNLFPEEHVPTVFDNYQSSVMVDGKNYVLGMWDTSGQDDYDRLRPLSYNGTDIFLVCFAVNSITSFNNVKSKWIVEKQNYAKDVPFILVGLKTDLRGTGGTPVVTKSMAEQMCVDLKAVKYMECSARTQQGLKQVFDEAIQTVLYNRRSPQTKKVSKCCIM